MEEEGCVGTATNIHPKPYPRTAQDSSAYSRLFPVGIPLKWPSPLQLLSHQYMTAGKHVNVDLCFFLRVAATHVDICSPY
jgi:hypothetical protein